MRPVAEQDGDVLLADNDKFQSVPARIPVSGSAATFCELLR